jgi:hypothetical protein
MRTLHVPERSTMLYWTMGIGLFVIAGFLGIVMWQGSSPPDSSVSNASPVFRQDSAQVLPDRPVVIEHSSGGVTLNVPCCSLGIGGTITMVEREPDLLSEPYWEKVWSRPKVIQTEFTDRSGEVVPNAYSSTALEVCFTLTKEQRQELLEEPNRIEIQYYDNMYRPYEWRRLSSYASEDGQKICAQVSRLSLFALAVMNEDIPLTGGNEPYQP